MSKERLIKIVVVLCATIGIIGLTGIIFDKDEETESAVKVVSQKMLIPGGQSVGIKMNVKGVLVVGLEEIETIDGIVNPGYDAGLQIGDRITEIDGQKVYYAKDVSKIVNNNHGENIAVKIQRKDATLFREISPALDHVSKEYKIGVWVKEKIAGIGTLSFFDPENDVYAALGHGIFESQTGELLDAGDGFLLETEVKSVNEGVSGKPGEIRGIFYSDEAPIGRVKKNSIYGIYSKGAPAPYLEKEKPLIVGTQSQVEKGKAYILTTIEGNKVEKFEINITKINRQKEPDSKGLEIKVTDKRLLSHCGGIVQGMSGSPIIQNNRIIGAVTHVLVNEPSKGYGIFIEWMLNECKKL